MEMIFSFFFYVQNLGQFSIKKMNNSSVMYFEDGERRKKYRCENHSCVQLRRSLHCLTCSQEMNVNMRNAFAVEECA